MKKLEPTATRATEGAEMRVRERNEHTIAERVRLSGRGYWSGEGVNLRFLPAAAGTGIRFVRTDLPGKPEIPVAPDNRHDQALRTVLQVDGARVEMIEHLLAALGGLAIDNCRVEVDRQELPGLDGSAAGYVDVLRSAGLVMQGQSRRRIVVDRPLRVGDAGGWVEALPSPDGMMHLEYRLDYGGDSPIRPQTFRCVLTPENFCRDLAPARTFVTKEQATQLRQAGLGKHVTNRDLLVFGDSGPVDNLLRYVDECARHKTLDLVGDLNVVGADLIGCFTSYRGGHQLNGKLATELIAAANCVSAGCRGAA